MSTLVYVINQNGHALMPCHPSKARKLLRDRRAKVIGRSPFTIQLLWDCEEQVQEVTLGIDKGSHVTGFSCIGRGQILLSGEIHHRLDVKDKMAARRTNRRNRRSRKWYRPARFLNRGSSQRSGRLPPSIKTNAEEVIRVVERIPLPISSIVIEDVQVDIARLNDPALRGSQYQDPTRLDENLRMACLMRDGYRCQQCGTHTCRLEAHHILYRRRGGKDTLTNLLTLCERCHHLLHEGKIQLKVTGVSGHLDQIAQRTMQGKSHLYAHLVGLSLCRPALATRRRPCAKRETCPKRMMPMPSVWQPTVLVSWCPTIESTSTACCFDLAEHAGSTTISHAKARVASSIKSMRSWKVFEKEMWCVSKGNTSSKSTQFTRMGIWRLSVSKGSRTRPDRMIVRWLNADEPCFGKGGRNCEKPLHFRRVWRTRFDTLQAYMV